MPMLSREIINGTLLRDPGEDMLVDVITVGAGLAGDARILEDDVTDRITEDDDTRIVEND